MHADGLAREGAKYELVRTKLAPPRFARTLIERPQLLDRLGEGAYRALTIIKGPAGFGKTTVAAQWRRDLIVGGKRVAWISLDVDDNDEGVFLSYFVKALEMAECPFAKGLMSIYQRGQAESGRAVIRALINDLAQFNTEIFVIIDDFHYISSPKINALIQELLAHSPPHFHLVLITRVEARLSLAELRLKDQVTQICVPDLRFSFAEAKAFIEHRIGKDLEISEIEVIYDLTEGWIAAIQWVALGLTQNQDLKKHLSGYGGEKAGLATYMAQSIVSELPDEIERFLVKTCILDRLNPDLCVAVTGMKDAGKLLKQLETENLCLLPIENEPDWYRYHPIFLHYLRDRLLAHYIKDIGRLSARLGEWVADRGHGYDSKIGTFLLAEAGDRVDILDLHRRAAVWFQSHGYTVQAVQHALGAGDMPMALDLLEESAITLLENAEVNTLLAWADRVDRKAVEERGRLMLAFGWAYCLTCQTAQAQEICDALEANFDRYRNVTRFEVGALRHAVSAYLDDPTRAAELESLWPPIGDPFNVGAGTNVLAFGHVLCGRYEKALTILRWAEQSPKVASSYFPAVFRGSITAMALSIMGNLREAEARCRTVLASAEERHGRRSVAACIATGNLAHILYETNRLTEAEAVLANRYDVINRGVFPDGLIRAHLSGSRTYFALGQGDAAQDVLERLRQYAEIATNERAHAAYLAEQVRQALAQGLDASAERRQAELDRLDELYGSDAMGSRSELRLYAQQSRIRWDIHRGRPGRAEGLVDQLLTQYGRSGRRPLLARLAIQKAIARAAHFDAEGASAAMRTAAELGEACGLRRTFLDAGPKAEPLIRSLLGGGRLSVTTTRYLEELLGEFDMDGTEALREVVLDGSREITIGEGRLGSGDAVSLSERETEIVSLLSQGLPNKRIALALNISDETVKWHLKRVYLKLGVSCRVHAVDRARDLALVE